MIKASPATTGSITIAELFERKKETLQLDLITPGVDLSGLAQDEDVSSPGVALAGYTERFVPGRIQVLGQTEMMYLNSLGEERAAELLRDLFQFDIPVVFITKGQDVPDYFRDIAEEAGIPVLRAQVSTKEVYARLKPFIEAQLAPTTNLHGSLADVYGVGLLFVGDSGIGKSECVLDLVERGHRLVADDLVIAKKRGNDILMGEGHHLQGHHMEIRGLGIVDIKALFGIRAIRHQKRIEVVVQLENWDSTKPYDRTGLDQQEVEILGVKLPTVTVPLNPGKNITVISEVVAMNHLLKYSGVDSSALFNLKLQQAMGAEQAAGREDMAPVRREYLEQDYE